MLRDGNIAVLYLPSIIEAEYSKQLPVISPMDIIFSQQVIADDAACLRRYCAMRINRVPGLP